MTARWEKLLTWSVLGAAVASVPTTYLHSSKGSAHEVGVVLGWMIWIIFATEVMVMVGYSDDAQAWLRGHQFELIVTATSFPFFLDLPGIRELIGVFPALGAVKLLKALKILKLAKVFKLLHASSLAGWLVRLLTMCGSLVALGILGAMVAERKISSPVHGIAYLGDEISVITNTDRTIAIAALVVVIVVFVEWWAWHRRRDATQAHS